MVFVGAGVVSDGAGVEVLGAGVDVLGAGVEVLGAGVVGWAVALGTFAQLISRTEVGRPAQVRGTVPEMVNEEPDVEPFAVIVIFLPAWPTALAAESVVLALYGVTLFST